MGGVWWKWLQQCNAAGCGHATNGMMLLKPSQYTGYYVLSSGLHSLASLQTHLQSGCLKVSHVMHT